jgi:hypothetical protein
VIGGKVVDHPAPSSPTFGAVWRWTRFSSVEALKVIGLLDESRAWDGIAGQVILVARQRGWPVLTTDPDRLKRIASDLDVNLR